MTTNIKKIVKNIVVIGDGDTGKTCLLYTFTDGKFNAEYTPTIYDNEVIDIKLNNRVQTVKLHDTAGQEEFERLRRMTYKTADAFILCYSINQRTSFDNILEKWSPELRSTNPYTPIILVGTKSDLRQSLNHRKMIGTMEGKLLKDKIGAVSFLECSAKTFFNINEVIYEAVNATNLNLKLKTKIKKNCFCCCWC